jgi:hypothetical protein
MIESIQDKFGGTPTTNMSTAKLHSWTRLSTHLGLTDIHRTDDFTSLSTKNYSWDNRQAGQANIMTRINRFCMASHILDNGGLYGILPSLLHISDHAPILVSLRKSRHCRPKAPAFSSTLLSDKEQLKQLKHLWASIHLLTKLEQ